LGGKAGRDIYIDVSEEEDSDDFPPLSLDMDDLKIPASWKVLVYG